MNEDTDTAAIAFTISDIDNTLDCTTSVTGGSSNNSVVLSTAGAYLFAGGATNCTVVVTPVANASGTPTITLTVSDPDL